MKNTRPMSQCDILSGAKTRGFDRSGYAFPRQGALPAVLVLRGGLPNDVCFDSGEDSAGAFGKGQAEVRKNREIRKTDREERCEIHSLLFHAAFPFVKSPTSWHCPSFSRETPHSGT
ncbi:MAG: hypothetical protein PUE63_05070 [Lachnospiraceae bacterium]|nr:hypothetical protein [Lachnospiraceae bacterium]